MRLLVLLITLMTYTSLIGQLKKDISTEIKDVTVFLSGAQITRNGTATLPQGEHLLTFSALSPYIDKKSIQFKTNRNLTVLSVNYQLDFLSAEEQSASYRHLQESIDSLTGIKRIEEAMIEVIEEDIDFLIDNRQLSHDTQAVSPSQLDAMAQYQSKRMVELKLKKIERNAYLREINENIGQYYNQIELSKNQTEALGQILIKVDVKTAGTIPVVLNYVTENASWYPSYDIEVNRLDQPMQLSYKANIIQQTKEDWSQVSLTFSSNNPTVSPIAPELKTYYLDYHLLPPSYNDISKGITGVVRDRSGEALIGANIIVKGTTIGTITDLDGSFELPRPDLGSQLTVSYTGYVSQDVYIQDRPMTIVLKEGELLDEVVVTGYSGNSRKSGRYAKESLSEEELVPMLQGKIRGMSTQPIPVTLKEKTTSVSFKIDQPYTIKSDHQAYAVEMIGIMVPTRYEYLTIPKINSNAYLIAHVEDWEQYNFLAGQANIILENTFIGSSLLDLSGANDVLKISLGIDKSVYVKREQKQDYKDKKFLGRNKTEVIEWYTTVKNNKEQAINIKVLDQIPVSNNEEIEVSIEESSKANIAEDIGLCTWQLTLNANQEQELRLVYEVKYPKNRQLSVE